MRISAFRDRLTKLFRSRQRSTLRNTPMEASASALENAMVDALPDIDSGTVVPAGDRPITPETRNQPRLSMRSRVIMTVASLLLLAVIGKLALNQPRSTVLTHYPQRQTAEQPKATSPISPKSTSIPTRGRARAITASGTAGRSKLLAASTTPAAPKLNGMARYLTANTDPFGTHEPLVIHKPAPPAHLLVAPSLPVTPQVPRLPALHEIASPITSSNLVLLGNTPTDVSATHFVLPSTPVPQPTRPAPVKNKPIAETKPVPATSPPLLRAIFYRDGHSSTAVLLLNGVLHSVSNGSVLAHRYIVDIIGPNSVRVRDGAHASTLRLP